MNTPLDNLTDRERARFRRICETSTVWSERFTMVNAWVAFIVGVIGIVAFQLKHQPNAVFTSFFLVIWGSFLSDRASMRSLIRKLGPESREPPNPKSGLTGGRTLAILLSVSFWAFILFCIYKVAGE